MVDMCHVSSSTSCVSSQDHITSSDVAHVTHSIHPRVAERKVLRPCLEIMKNRWNHGVYQKTDSQLNIFMILHGAILKDETASISSVFPHGGHTPFLHVLANSDNLRRKNGQPVSRQGAARCEFVKLWWTIVLILSYTLYSQEGISWQYVLWWHVVSLSSLQTLRKIIHWSDFETNIMRLHANWRVFIKRIMCIAALSLPWGCAFCSLVREWHISMNLKEQTRRLWGKPWQPRFAQIAPLLKSIAGRPHLQSGGSFRTGTLGGRLQGPRQAQHLGSWHHLWLSSGSCSLVWTLCWCHSGLLQALHG